MSIASPTHSETALARAWAEGQTYLPASKVDIDAGVIRALLIGTFQAGPLPPGPARIVGAMITGCLDLENVRSRTARGTLPHFEAISCRFENRLSLAFTAMDGLSLIDCDLPGLDLRGARVDGEVNLSGSRIGLESENDESPVAVMGDGADIRCDVRLRGALGRRFESRGAVSFRLARVGGNLSANGAKMSNPTGAALDCDGAAVTGGVSLAMEDAHRFEGTGGMRFAGAKLGSLAAEGADLTGGDREAALNCEGASIAGEVQLRATGVEPTTPFRAIGEIRLVGADIGELDLTGAQLCHQGKIAIQADRLTVKGGAYLGQTNRPRTIFQGDVQLAGARIIGELSASNTDLRGTLSLADATIEGSLYLRDVKTDPRVAAGMSVSFLFTGLTVKAAMTLAKIVGPAQEVPSGFYRFDGAKADRLIDDPDTAWPQAGRLVIDGFTYRCIDAGADDRKSIEKRIEWLDRQFATDRMGVTFTPQPFEHLASVLRSEGRDHEADRIAIRKRDLAIKYSPNGLISTLPARFMQLIGHGYDRPKAFWFAVSWWGFGMLWIWLAAYVHLATFERVHPTPRPEYTALFGPGFHNGVFDLDGRYTEWQRDGCPGVVIPVYAIELMLPIADLGQDSECRLETHESNGDIFWGGLLQAARAIYQIVGAILIAVLGVALTGLVRKD